MGPPTESGSLAALLRTFPGHAFRPRINIHLWNHRYPASAWKSSSALSGTSDFWRVLLHLCLLKVVRRRSFQASRSAISSSGGRHFRQKTSRPMSQRRQDRAGWMRALGTIAPCKNQASFFSPVFTRRGQCRYSLSMVTMVCRALPQNPLQRSFPVYRPAWSRTRVTSFKRSSPGTGGDVAGFLFACRVTIRRNGPAFQVPKRIDKLDPTGRTMSEATFFNVWSTESSEKQKELVAAMVREAPALQAKEGFLELLLWSESGGDNRVIVRGRWASLEAFEATVANDPDAMASRNELAKLGTPAPGSFASALCFLPSQASAHQENDLDQATGSEAL
jgi:heme-degrading monooxygenase HmoA